MPWVLFVSFFLFCFVFERKTKGAVIVNEIYYAADEFSRVNCDLSLDRFVPSSRFMSCCLKLISSVSSAHFRFAILVECCIQKWRRDIMPLWSCSIGQIFWFFFWITNLTNCEPLANPYLYQNVCRSAVFVFVLVCSFLFEPNKSIINSSLSIFR